MLNKILIIGLLLAAAWNCSGFFTEYHVEYSRHVVSQGETLWDIAGKYYSRQDKYNHFGEFVHSISSVNDIGQFIEPGQVITVPLYIEAENE